MFFSSISFSKKTITSKAMRYRRIFSHLVLFAAGWMIAGCSILDLSPKVVVKGRVVRYRNKVPIEGVSVVAYKQLFNCGAVCSTYNRTSDSTGTDSNGNFTLNASESDLILGVYKKGYFGLSPGNSKELRFRGTKTDFGDILLKPYGEIAIKLVNTTSGRDSISYKIYACGEDVDRGLYPPIYVLTKEFTIKTPVEADCEVFIYITLVRNGKTTTIKESFYLNINETKYRTVEL